MLQNDGMFEDFQDGERGRDKSRDSASGARSRSTDASSATGARQEQRTRAIPPQWLARCSLGPASRATNRGKRTPRTPRIGHTTNTEHEYYINHVQSKSDPHHFCHRTHFSSIKTFSFFRLYFQIKQVVFLTLFTSSLASVGWLVD